MVLCPAIQEASTGKNPAQISRPLPTGTRAGHVEDGPTVVDRMEHWRHVRSGDRRLWPYCRGTGEAEVPAELDRAILKALSKAAAERFQSAEEFRGVLLHLAELLRHPPGWLETSTFCTAPSAPAEVSAPRPAAGLLLTAPSVPPRQQAPSNADEGGPAREHRRGTSRAIILVALAIIFLVTGAASAVIVALVYGAP